METFQLKTNIKNLICLLLVLFLGTAKASAQVQIDSVKTTSSTCPNNGTLSVYAKTSNPPLLYSITAGPVIQAAQTNFIFNALTPGNYTIKVSDATGNSKSQAITVTGTYTPLNFTPITKSPTCKGGNNGSITGNKSATSGKGPFTWQLIAPSPVITAPQSSDVFNNLPAGNYTVRLTDDCGSYRTIVATVSDPVTTFRFYNTPPIVEVIGCDSVWVTTLLLFNPATVRLPLTYKYQTKNGIFTTTLATKIDTSNLRTLGVVRIEQLLKNVNYGDQIRTTIYNACGDSVSTPSSIPPYAFTPKYTYGNCGTTVTARYDYTNDGNIVYGLKAPLTYSYVNTATNTVTDAGTINGDPAHDYSKIIVSVPILPALTPGTTYKLTIKDGCGKTFQQTYTIPLQAKPAGPWNDITAISCIDSVIGGYRIQATNLASGAKLTLLSGPSVLKSTKTGFAYQDTYTYPKIIPIGFANNTTTYFFLGNIGVGAYTFKITDDCGNELNSSFVVNPSQVTSLYKNVSYKKGCLGQNKIYYSVGGMADVTVKNISTGAVLKTSKVSGKSPNYGKDSVLNVPSGTYVITYEYDQGGYGTYVNDNIHSCLILRDTITIEGYETPEIATSNSILCHNAITMEVIPDSTKGVPPYQYEVISGPQTFAVQTKNVFTVNAPGSYIVRIYDVCGNASTKQVFVDTLTLPSIPPEVDRNCNSVKLSYPSSHYFTYKWTRPNHSVYTGASLSINPITPQDTGWYTISRIVSINGCKDTSNRQYHLTLANITEQYKTICEGEMVTIGVHQYASTGIYSDTMVSAMGCDSIVMLHLTVLDKKRTTITKTICPGQSFFFGGQNYFNAGTYHDTLSTTTCDSIVTLQLSIAIPPMVNLGKDTSICQGQSLLLNAGNHKAYFWNDNFTDSIHASTSIQNPGKYWVMVKNNEGCTSSDTLELVNVHTAPIASVGSNPTICLGNTATLSASGGASYKWLPSGETTATITVKPSVQSVYSVIVYDTNQCASAPTQITVTISQASSLPLFEAESITHCFDEGPIALKAAWGNTFLWPATGETSQGISVNEEGTYMVNVFDTNGCPANGSILVKQYCPPQLYLPSAFSPNGDQQNDEVEIFGKHFRNFELKIFNRWGEIIFISNDRNERWDGTYRGEQMPVGTYPWILSYEGEYNENQQETTLKGSITLIR